MVSDKIGNAEKSCSIDFTPSEIKVGNKKYLVSNFEMP
jgi:hypothetical protein